MNIYFWIIIVTVLIGFILDMIADSLNLKALDPKLPKEFEDVYDKDTYKKSQEYTRVRTKFGFITSIYGLVLLLVFWFIEGFNILDLYLRELISDDIIRGIVFIGVISVGNSILSFPFSIYSTFVIEERFGFNKTTVKTFILDIVKGTVLGIVIGVPILWLVLYIFQELGTLAWLYGWGAVTVITLMLQYVAPKWIMPLFNKFTPLEEGELKTAIMDLAERVDYSLKDVYVMDGSKRSSKSNAFFTGFGKNKKIALFDTLIEKHTVDELVAVLAHEIGHYKKKHILQGMLISITHTGVLFFLLSIFLSEKGLYDAFFMDNMSIYTGILFFGMLYSSIDTVLSLFMNILSRKNEFEADEFAVNSISNKESMISALKKLSKDNLSNLTPHKFNVFLNYSHPPVSNRINNLYEKIRNSY